MQKFCNWEFFLQYLTTFNSGFYKILRWIISNDNFSCWCDGDDGVGGFKDELAKTGGNCRNKKKFLPINFFANLLRNVFQ